MSVLSKSRSVLVLADEGLQVFYVSGSSVRTVQYIPWEDDGFHEVLTRSLTRACKRSPVVILNDMVEQHYRKESIPKVSVLDKANVLKRRLAVAFPNYPVRAALQLKGKTVSGASYLFAATPASDSFKKTLFAISATGVELVGVYLLPIESASMVKTLSTKLNKSNRNKASWTIFVGQHHNGNVRQVVTRDGDLALTRLTPVVDTDVEPELWAKELSGELDATMSYLTRFGYQESDGLNIIVVANEESQSFLESFITIPCNLHVFPSNTLSRLVGAPIGRQEDYRYADPLHAAFLGRKTKFTLPMQAPIVQNLTQPRKTARYVLLMALVAFAYFSFNSFQSWQKAASTQNKLNMVVEENRSLKLEFERELVKKKELGFDFVLVNNSLEIFDSIQANRVEPLIIVEALSRSLESGLHLDKLVFDAIPFEEEKADDFGYDPSGGEEESSKGNYLEAVLTLSFPTTLAPEIGVQKVDELQKKLSENLEGYKIEVVKQIADLSYTGNFVGGTDDGQQANGADAIEKEDYNAEIRITEIIR